MLMMGLLLSFGVLWILWNQSLAPLQACSGVGFDHIIFPKKFSSHWAMAYVHSSGLPPLGGPNCHR